MQRFQRLILVLGIILFLVTIVLVWWCSRLDQQVTYNPERTTVQLPSTPIDPAIDEFQGILDVSLGNPSMYERFWQHELPTIQQQVGTLGISYYPETPEFLAQNVVDGIAYTHDIAIDPTEILVANGSFQLLVAYFRSLKQLVSEPENRLLIVMIHRPTYPLLVDALQSLGGINIVPIEYLGTPDVEYIVSPSNPIGDPVEAVSNAKYRLYDHAYAWPQFTPNYKEELIRSEGHDRVVSFSKGLGIAGFRCGFIQIQDPDLRVLVEETVKLQTIGLNTTGWSLYQAITNNRLLVDRVISYGQKLLEQRWQRLLAIGDPYLLNNNGAYAWFERPVYQFQQEKIRVVGGSILLSDDRFSRVSMITDDRTFDLFLTRLRRLQG